jgi:hypothetical protein
MPKTFLAGFGSTISSSPNFFKNKKNKPEEAIVVGALKPDNF